MKTKIVYLFDEVTGALKGEYEAQANPEEPGKFIEPTFSTDAPLPPMAAGETAIFDKGNWVVVPIPADPEVAPHVLTLGEEKAIAVAAINVACRISIISGFVSSALGEPHTYDSYETDQLNLIGALALGIDMPYRCADAGGAKAFRTHTAAQLKQVAIDGAAIKLAALEKASMLKDQIAAINETDADPVTAVKAVVWA